MTAAAVFRALQQLARARGRPTDEILTLYGLERVLSRLQRTSFRDDFVLKGGVLLAAFALRRPTRDVDMQAVDFALNEHHLRAVMSALAEVRADDGLVINTASVSVQQIRDGDEYSGLRVKFVARLHTARLPLALDVSTGDPIHPPAQPVTLPGLLGDDVQLMGHPAVMVVAEKTVTILQRGTQSTRWRDYVDLRNLARTRVFDAAEIASAVTAVASHRQVEIGPIAPLLVGYGARSQSRWAAWRRSQDLEIDCLEQLDDQVSAIVTFVDPVLTELLPAASTWVPTAYRWLPPD